MKINRRFFFDSVRKSLFAGKLSQPRVDGLTHLLDTWEQFYSEQDPRFLAYCLATAYHETARTMEPIHERGSDAYFTNLYDVQGKNPKRAQKMGNTEPGDGALYHGRGYVQVTWKTNYQYWTDELDFDFVSEPDAACNPDFAAYILFDGCMDGVFTSRKLEHYLTPKKDDWKNARGVVNGLDKADLIAGYAVKFYAALSYQS